VHRQSVLVFFAADVQFHQMPGELFSGPLRLWAIGKDAVYAQCAINRKNVHWNNSWERFSSD
jgi:hypothetical protein